MTSRLRGPEARAADIAGEMYDSEMMADCHVLGWLDNVHERQLGLCVLLEEIADALPAPVGESRASSAIPLLRTIIPRHIAIQERLLFPLLRRRARVDDDVETLIRQVSADNAADELLAHDTADQIEAAIKTKRPDNPDMLAYMLRGLFEGRRRHIAWEASVLIPLARKRLHPGDLKPLAEADIRFLLSIGND